MTDRHENRFRPPWTLEELGFWTSLGFENYTTEVKRYFLDGCD